MINLFLNQWPHSAEKIIFVSCVIEITWIYGHHSLPSFLTSHASAPILARYSTKLLHNQQRLIQPFSLFQSSTKFLSGRPKQKCIKIYIAYSNYAVYDSNASLVPKYSSQDSSVMEGGKMILNKLTL